jgi:simple sugar transport system permease protein
VISDLLTASVLVGVAASGIRLATSYLYAALGETFGQLSGVLNLGVEGIMLMGAYVAFYAVARTGNLLLGLGLALLLGALLGLAIGVVNITFKAKQGVSGIGLYLFGLGLSDLLFQKTLGEVQTVQGFPDVQLPFLSDLPIVGPILFSHNVLVYGAYLLVPISWFVINKTTFGLNILAVGQNPEAADSLGISVYRVRYLTQILGGTLSGLAGASLSVGLLNVFQQNLTSGQGFIAIALVYFGGWNPFGVMLGSLLFSTVNALQLWVQARDIPIPADFAVMMPYVLTIVALALAARRIINQPAALTVPYERGEA